MYVNELTSTRVNKQTNPKRRKDEEKNITHANKSQPQKELIIVLYPHTKNPQKTHTHTQKNNNTANPIFPPY